MCLVVDTDRAHIIFGTPFSDAARPIWRWLKRDGILVYGGRLASEVERLHSTRRLLAELYRSGKAILEDAAAVRREEQRYLAEGNLRSNDPHVLALARVSGARVLFTGDQLLIKDFCNPRHLRPKGKVYQRSEHKRLLRHRRGCRGFKAR